MREKPIRQSKDERDINVDGDTLRWMKQSLSYKGKSGYYIILPDKRLISFILLLVLSNTKSLSKKMLKKLSSLQSEDKAKIFKDFFEVNDKRKQFILPDQIESLVNALNEHYSVIQKYANQFDSTSLGGLLDGENKGKYQIRWIQSNQYFYKGMNNSIKFDEQDIFLINRNNNQIIMAFFSSKETKSHKQETQFSVLKNSNSTRYPQIERNSKNQNYYLLEKMNSEPNFFWLELECIYFIFFISILLFLIALNVNAGFIMEIISNSFPNNRILQKLMNFIDLWQMQ